MHGMHEQIGILLQQGASVNSIPNGHDASEIAEQTIANFKAEDTNETEEQIVPESNDEYSPSPEVKSAAVINPQNVAVDLLFLGLVLDGKQSTLQQLISSPHLLLLKDRFARLRDNDENPLQDGLTATIDRVGTLFGLAR